MAASPTFRRPRSRRDDSRYRPRSSRSHRRARRSRRRSYPRKDDYRRRRSHSRTPVNYARGKRRDSRSRDDRRDVGNRRRRSRSNSTFRVVRGHTSCMRSRSSRRRSQSNAHRWSRSPQDAAMQSEIGSGREEDGKEVSGDVKCKAILVPRSGWDVAPSEDSSKPSGDTRDEPSSCKQQVELTIPSELEPREAPPTLDSSAPPGLLLGQTHPSLLQAAVNEMVTELDRNQNSRQVSHRSQDGRGEILEAGVRFTDAQFMGGTQKFCNGLSLEKRLPATLRLLQDAMLSVAKENPQMQFQKGPEQLRCKSRVNVIIRRYSPGQRLGFHTDALGLFTDEIWGCVVHTDNPGWVGLEFRSSDVNRSCARSWYLPERPGLVSCLTGPSRESWIHGVDWKGCNGRRLSVTWRWFRDDCIAWSISSVAERKLWMTTFIAFLISKAQIRDETVIEFLTHHSEASLTGARRMFRNKNDACGPQLTRVASWQALQEGKDLCAQLGDTALSAHSDAHQQSSLALCALASSETVARCRLFLSAWEARGPDGALQAVLTLRHAWSAIGEVLSLVHKPDEAITSILA